MSLINKEQHLQKLLQDKKNIIIAFSGGVDSTYLLNVASRTPDIKILAVTAKSPLHMNSEGEFAVNYARELKIVHATFEIPLLEYDLIKRNDRHRCYHCKKVIFSYIKEQCSDIPGYIIADGTNTDDFSDYRPGLKACEELGVWHPLAEANLSKSEIYQLSHLYNLPTATKAPFACLASRIPYGIELNEINLTQVESSEQILAAYGFRQYRVRHHGEIARIELEEHDFERIIDQELRVEVVTELKKIGFNYVTLDLGGYQQGNMNLSLSENKTMEE